MATNGDEFSMEVDQVEHEAEAMSTPDNPMLPQASQAQDFQFQPPARPIRPLGRWTPRHPVAAPRGPRRDSYAYYGRLDASQAQSDRVASLDYDEPSVPVNARSFPSDPAAVSYTTPASRVTQLLDL